MGLGVHGGGLGVARFLATQGADVTVTDLRSPDLLAAPIAALRDLPIRYVLGEHRDDDFRNADLVIRNPAVPRESRYLQIARAAGARVEMEMTLFFRLCPGPILGVTGTKGKTTTTLLTGAMLREQYPDTVVAGNLRVSALEALPRISPTTPVVLELSSFVLEGLGEAGLSPPFACITNLSPDHLDRYQTMAAYGEAKRQILLHQGSNGVVVLPRRDPIVSPWAADAPGRVIWFDAQADQIRADGQATMFYGDRGLAWHDPAANEPAVTHIYMQRICEPGDIHLPGAHNLANVAAAATLAQAFGVGVDHIRQAIRSFSGVEHRLEFVRELEGVRYVNDTAATAPEAAIAALQSFDRPIVLIAGGADKNLPFDGLARTIVQRVKTVVLLRGTATAALMAALAIAGAERTGDLWVRPEARGQPDKETERQGEPGDASSLFSSSRATQVTVDGPYDAFEPAVRAARNLAAPGDIVLLSPGCASFGMFRNEFHRGEEFRRIVQSFEQ
jgi:UDP-N-acetylmuramoylalanine--D-glutamate ligase